ncbi:MAG TPA: hypothetical protein VJP02_20925 [Candidatus Sulfotelmatobacter sp.]|nr:hypothetical protein [Candidatus Sulfotelmatobacter sp.]
MRHTALGVGIALYLSVTGVTGGLQAQTESNSQASPAGQSLGEYARQVRKEPDAKPKKKVFDNDNLPKEDKLSVVGNAPAPGAEAAAAPAESKPAETANTAPGGQPKAEAGAPPADTSKMDQAEKEAAWKQWADKIAQQQQTIDLLTRELDVVQREYQIRAAAMYADVGNRLRNSADWDKQDAQYKQQIADKQKALDDAKQKLEDLREEARKAGVPSSVREP